MVVYLSGINTDEDLIELFRLKVDLLSMGCTIITPEENKLNKLKWSQNLRLRLSFLQSCNAIYMFPNWKESVIARIELTEAMKSKMSLCFSIEDIKECIITLDS